MKQIGVGLIGSQFVSAIHFDALAQVPGARSRGRRLADDRACPPLRRIARHRPLVCRLSAVARDAGDRHGRPRTAQRLALRSRARRPGSGGQTCCARETDGAEPLRVRQDDRRLPTRRREVNVCRRALLRAEVRAAQTAARLWRAGQAASCQTVRKARRAPFRLVLGCQPKRRRRDDGHGMSRHRVLPLDALGPRLREATSRDKRLCPSGDARSRREDPRRRRSADSRRVRERLAPAWPK